MSGKLRPSQQNYLSFPIIVKQGHSSSRTSSLKLNSSFPDCWSSKTIGLGQFQALPNELNILYHNRNFGLLAKCENNQAQNQSEWFSILTMGLVKA